MTDQSLATVPKFVKDRLVRIESKLTQLLETYLADREAMLHRMDLLEQRLDALEAHPDA